MVMPWAISPFKAGLFAEHRILLLAMPRPQRFSAYVNTHMPALLFLDIFCDIE
jgi:hypothetical protein